MSLTPARDGVNNPALNSTQQGKGKIMFNIIYLLTGKCFHKFNDHELRDMNIDPRCTRCGKTITECSLDKTNKVNKKKLNKYKKRLRKIFIKKLKKDLILC